MGSNDIGNAITGMGLFAGMLAVTVGCSLAHSLGLYQQPCPSL